MHTAAVAAAWVHSAQKYTNNRRDTAARYSNPKRYMTKQTSETEVLPTCVKNQGTNVLADGKEHDT